MQKFSFTWLGHATFVFRTPGGKRVILDPWLQTNPSCPESAKKVRDIDLILVTHGHSDHASDVVPVARETHAMVVAPFELGVWFGQKGLQRVTGMNPGGTLDVLGLSITMVPAVHSSSVEDDGKIIYLGVATGYIVKFEN